MAGKCPSCGARVCHQVDDMRGEEYVWCGNCGWELGDDIEAICEGCDMPADECECNSIDELMIDQYLEARGL